MPRFRNNVFMKVKKKVLYIAGKRNMFKKRLDLSLLTMRRDDKAVLYSRKIGKEIEFQNNG